jgi:hypothetical protein
MSRRVYGLGPWRAGVLDLDAECARERARVSAAVECDLICMRMLLARVNAAIAELERRRAALGERAGYTSSRHSATVTP